MSYAERFYDELQSKFKAKMEESESQYTNSTSWTNAIKPIIEEILTDLDKSTNVGEIEVNREYYRIDYIGWKQRKKELSTRETGLKPYLWELLFAVEHENDSRDWLDEVCKLAFIRCPLRVVIGYDTSNAATKFEVAKDILAKTKAFTGEDQEFLIILGPSEKEYNAGEREFIYTIIKQSNLPNE